MKILNHLTGFLKILRYHSSCQSIQRGDVRMNRWILIGFHGGTIMSDIFSQDQPQVHYCAEVVAGVGRSGFSWQPVWRVAVS
jgi:hypothetical protein